MLRHALLICPPLAVLLIVGAGAQQSKPPLNSTVDTLQKNGAEVVFATAASKVVFLITRKSGELQARASGVVLTADGFIATNYHALAGADAVEIRFFPNAVDSENYQSFNGAKLLYADRERDIAILKVTSKSLPFLECPARTGCEPRVGETVYAIGNPKGLTNTISEGIVSALRADAGEDIIQHTAPISPGSSGGALVDSNGDLLGINSWQVTDAQNLNFAISAKYLFEALSKARQTTSALSFPPESSNEGDSSLESTAEQALRSRDYIQAINQAEQAVASGISNAHIYEILGAANGVQGKEREAEPYLRQAISLAGPDDKYKQTSRLLLIRILAGRFSAAPGSVDRLAFLQLINDFLDSHSPLGDAESYNDMRTWAASLVKPLRSIDGYWQEIPLTLVGPPNCEGDYVLASSGGNFMVDFIPAASADKDVVCILRGTIAPSGDGFAGEIDREVIVNRPPLRGLAEQHLQVEFKLSDDLMTIEGTARGGAITKGGADGKFVVGLLSFPPGPTGPWHFTFHRAQ